MVQLWRLDGRCPGLGHPSRSARRARARRCG